MRANLDRSLRRTPALIGYPDLVCHIQSVKPQPRAQTFEQSRFPALKVKVAYAERDSRQHERLQNGDYPTVLTVDISYHEPVHAVALIRLNDDARLA